MHVTARDVARFAQLYIEDGVFDGTQVISSEWVHDSLQAYSTGEQLEYVPRAGPNFNRTGYGYQWWRLQSGDHEYAAMLGHGGQTIALLDELDMVIVVIGDPFWLEDGWSSARELKNLVADFIASLPSE
jgi:CubicO group peptidase (beta-lactamase class C family)